MECNGDHFNFGSAFIAVDWEPTALHLRYQTSQERVSFRSIVCYNIVFPKATNEAIVICHDFFQTYKEHMSVEESRRLQTEPIDLDACLKSFTREEELGEDELYYCSKCKKHRLAAKKLEIWKLPPVLVSLSNKFMVNT